MLSNVQIIYGLCIIGALFLSRDYITNMFRSQDMISRDTVQPEVAVKILQVENSAIPMYLNFSGVLKSRNSVQLKTEKPGRVVFINQNEFCKKGDIIIKLDTEFEEAQLLSTQGALQKAEDALTRAQGRSKQPGAVSSSEMNTYESEYKSALGKSKTAEADLKKMTMYAEFDAKLGIPNVSVGSRVNANDIIVTYASYNDFIIDFSISESSIKDIYAGKKITVSSPIFTGLKEAVIEKVDPNAEATYVIKVRASLSSQVDLNDLYSGVSVKVAVLSDKTEVVANIDERAIEEKSSGTPYIYVCEDNIAVRRPIEVLYRSNGRAAVKNLAPGTKYCMPVRGVLLDQRKVKNKDDQVEPKNEEEKQEVTESNYEDGDEDV